MSPNGGFSQMPDRQSPEERRAIAERQRRVWHLRVVRKLHVAEIAPLVGVSERQVERDLAVVRRRARSLLRRAQEAEESVLDAGLEACAELDAATRQAWADCLAAPEGSPARARFLNIVLKSIEQRVKILQSLGLMEKVPEEVLFGELDLHQLSDGEARSALAFLRACAARARSEAGGAAGDAAEPEAVDRGEPVDSHEG
jgi:hypothetical protein